ncbi:hypothetical protein Slin14017_G041040 [Septoria linicola]|nr:hypothetical protein Slin14017_G041040 [Septoria linicola]
MQEDTDNRAIEDSIAAPHGRTHAIGDIIDHAAEAELGTSTQRRKLQNRRNQKARRLRLKEHAAELPEDGRPFQVSRWRLDEAEEDFSHVRSSAPENTTSFTRVQLSADNCLRIAKFTYGPGGANHTWLVEPIMMFPLSTDHLLHLVQHNVFRAFVSNKRTLNTLLTGWIDAPPSPGTCPISCPRYRDDTTVYPLNPNIPPTLVPTPLQQARLHSFWINSIPFPRVRDNLITSQERFDHWELLQDLIGELMGATPDENQFPVTAQRIGCLG